MQALVPWDWMLTPIVPRGSYCLCYVTDCCKSLKAYFKCVLGYGVFFLPQNKIVLVEWKSCFIKKLLEFSIFAFQWLQITSRAKLMTYLPTCGVERMVPDTAATFFPHTH